MTAKNNIRTTTRLTQDVSAVELDQLYGLMANHFDGVQRSTFEKDFNEKEWVFLLKDVDTQQIKGFSTLTSLRIELDGQPVYAWFTGDTIIAPEHWGDIGFLHTIGTHWFKHAPNRHDANQPLYWLLLTCTHRSYKFLPGFFYHYFPRINTETPPAIRRIVNALVSRKFPADYDPKDGVIHQNPPTPIRRDRDGAVSADMDDPNVKFFFDRNPDYKRGDFLVCIAELSPDNITPIGKRVLGKECEDYFGLATTG